MDRLTLPQAKIVSTLLLKNHYCGRPGVEVREKTLLKIAQQPRPLTRIAVEELLALRLIGVRVPKGTGFTPRLYHLKHNRLRRFLEAV